MTGGPPGEHRSLDDVWVWYVFQRALVGEEKARVAADLVAGAGGAPRYVGKTREELNREFDDQSFELGQAAMLMLFAAAEASLRLDFEQRVRQRKKDAVSRQFRDVDKEYGQRVRLDDILDIWREFSLANRVKNAVSEFKGAFNLRHWLAHGRHWTPKPGRAQGYLPGDIFDICRRLLEETELL